MKRCSFPPGITIKPDGVHELSPHPFELREIHRNVITVLDKCIDCGDILMTWRRQPDTESEYIGERYIDTTFEGPDPCIYQTHKVYRNTTVEVLICKECGYISVDWKPQPDTEEIDPDDFDEYEYRTFYSNGEKVIIEDENGNFDWDI